MIRLLFVCHGNICRSPMAQYIMRDMVMKAGLEGETAIDSAAATGEELGNPVYPPAARILREHNAPGLRRVRSAHRHGSRKHQGHAADLRGRFGREDKAPPGLRRSSRAGGRGSLVYTRLPRGLAGYQDRLPRSYGDDLRRWISQISIRPENGSAVRFSAAVIRK